MRYSITLLALAAMTLASGCFVDVDDIEDTGYEPADELVTDLIGIEEDEAGEVWVNGLGFEESERYAEKTNVWCVQKVELQVPDNDGEIIFTWIEAATYVDDNGEPSESTFWAAMPDDTPEGVWACAVFGPCWEPMLQLKIDDPLVWHEQSYWFSIDRGLNITEVVGSDLANVLETELFRFVPPDGFVCEE